MKSAGVTFLASLATGCTVSVKAGKYVFKDATDSIVKELDAEGMQAFLKEMDVDLGDVTWGGGIGTNKTSIDTYEALLGSTSEKELKAIQKVDERQLLNQIDYDEVMAFGEGLSGGGSNSYSGEEWCRYFRETYGNNNVKWENATPSQWLEVGKVQENI